MALYEPNIYYLERHGFKCYDYNYFVKAVKVKGFIPCFVFVLKKEHCYMANIKGFEKHGNNPDVCFNAETAKDAVVGATELYNKVVEEHKIELPKLNDETIEAIT